MGIFRVFRGQERRNFSAVQTVAEREGFEPSVQVLARTTV